MDRENKTYLPLLLAIFMVFTTSSCIREEVRDCGATVRFMYVHNILSINALENHADEVFLYIFGEDGILVQQYSNASTPLTNDFMIRLNDLKSSNYHFVAWARSKHITSEQSYFSIPKLTAGVSSIDELTYMMKREDSGFQRHELNNFLVGMAEAVIDNHNSHVTVELRKVTNKIRVAILPYTSGNTLGVADYEFSIVDKTGNGYINYDYTLLPDKQITYLPYYASNLSPKDDVLSPNEVGRAAVVEINTSRLIEANAPRLHIVERKGSKEIVSLNLPWVFSLTGMEDHREWSLQEYLDRQDRYTIMLYLDDDNIWMTDTIIINGWSINNEKMEF